MPVLRPLTCVIVDDNEFNRLTLEHLVGMNESLTLLASLGDDLKFVTITSQAQLAQGETLGVSVTASTAQKCERCWHYRADVGVDANHPTICGRCVSNLFGAGEARKYA